MDGDAGKVLADTERCCWNGGILLFGTLIPWSMVTVGVLTTWVRWAELKLGCSTKKEKKKLLKLSSDFGKTTKICF